MSSRNESKDSRPKRPIIWVGRSEPPQGMTGRAHALIGHPLQWYPVTDDSVDRVIDLDPVIVVIELEARSTTTNKVLRSLEKLRQSQEFFLFLLLDREPTKFAHEADGYLVKGNGLSGQVKAVLRAALVTAKTRGETREELKRLKKETVRLRELVVRDDLTCLFNLRFFNRTLQNEHSRAKRFGRGYALIFIDVDGLRGINNEYGHLAGGRVLKQIAEYIRSKIRRIDVPARVGGDEFVIICPETKKLHACQVAERIRQGIEELNQQKDGPPKEITVSLGVAAFPDDGETSEQVLDCADRALFQAKATGKNRVRSWGDFSPTSEESESRASVHRGLSAEIAEEESDGVELGKELELEK